MGRNYDLGDCSRMLGPRTVAEEPRTVLPAPDIKRILRVGVAPSAADFLVGGHPLSDEVTVAAQHP